MSEIEEIDLLISSATYTGIKKCLNDYKNKLLLAESKINVPSSSSAAAPVASSSSSSSSSSTTTTSVFSTTSNLASNLSFIPLTDFSWEQGSYGSKDISIYVELKDVGTVKDNVKFTSTADSFDLTVTGLNGKNYRMLKDNLENDTVPDENKIIVKQNKVIIKLVKKKGQHSYEHWSQLISKKSKEEKSKRKADPTSGIMDMMKDLYNDGDDNMKKIIGEAMMKSQRGEKDVPDLDGKF